MLQISVQSLDLASAPGSLNPTSRINTVVPSPMLE